MESMEMFFLFPVVFTLFTAATWMHARECPTRTAKGLAWLFLVMNAMMIGVSAYTAGNPTALLLSPPLVHPGAICAISFPPDRAVFANGTGVPANWYVICAWHTSICAHVDVDDYNSTSAMPCYLHNGAQDEIDISMATISCETQQGVVPSRVLQNSCNVVIDDWYRSWIPRHTADTLFGQHEAALSRAQIVDDRSIATYAFCELATSAGQRRIVRNAVIPCMKPILNVINLLTLIAKRVDIVLNDTSAAIEKEFPVLDFRDHPLIQRIASKFGIDPLMSMGHLAIPLGMLAVCVLTMFLVFPRIAIVAVLLLVNLILLIVVWAIRVTCDANPVARTLADGIEKCVLIFTLYFCARQLEDGE